MSSDFRNADQYLRDRDRAHEQRAVVDDELLEPLAEPLVVCGHDVQVRVRDCMRSIVDPRRIDRPERREGTQPLHLLLATDHGLQGKRNRIGLGAGPECLSRPIQQSLVETQGLLAGVHLRHSGIGRLRQRGNQNLSART